MAFVRNVQIVIFFPFSLTLDPLFFSISLKLLLWLQICWILWIESDTKAQFLNFPLSKSISPSVAFYDLLFGCSIAAAVICQINKSLKWVISSVPTGSVLSTTLFLHFRNYFLSLISSHILIYSLSSRRFHFSLLLSVWKQPSQ